MWLSKEGVNGVNRLAKKGEKYCRLPTKREKNYRLPTEKKLTDYRHGPTLSTFVFRKLRSAENFVFFSSLRSNHIKVSYRISCHLLTFWPEEQSAGSFYRTISGTQAHETSHCNGGIGIGTYVVNPGSSRGKAFYPWDMREKEMRKKEMRGPLLSLVKSMHYFNHVVCSYGPAVLAMGGIIKVIASFFFPKRRRSRNRTPP